MVWPLALRLEGRDPAGIYHNDNDTRESQQQSREMQRGTEEEGMTCLQRVVNVGQLLWWPAEDYCEAQVPCPSSQLAARSTPNHIMFTARA